MTGRHDTTDYPPFGTLLKRYRRAAGLSQEQLAEQAGLSTDAISALERGVRQAPCRDTVRLLAQALGLSGDEYATLEAAVSRHAAAQLRLMHCTSLPSQKHQRPSSAGRTLTGGARDLPERQQTLRATLAWSYDLLGPREQALLRRLCAFTGGCTLEAAEAIGTLQQDTPEDILDQLGALVEKSLLQRESGAEGETRFTMLKDCSTEQGWTRRAHLIPLGVMG